jgi:hypothetical protein
MNGSELNENIFEFQKSIKGTQIGETEIKSPNQKIISFNSFVICVIFNII